LRRQPSLRSQLNQIRLWVRQGRTDAWIAHKLDVSIEQLARFKQDHDLNEGGGAPARPADPLSVPPPLPEPEAEEEPEEEEEAEEPEEPESDVSEPEPAPTRTRSRRGARSTPEPVEKPEDEEDEAEERAPGAARRGRRRGRRGGRRRRGRANTFEATFDHGEDGYGLWLDPAVVDNAVYAEHWAGHRAIRIILDRDTITIRRVDDAGEADSEESEDAET
jgi:hypothetical protein